MKDRHTIIVDVRADSQHAAFSFVERAIDAAVDALKEEKHLDDGDIRVTTPDGTESVIF